MSMIFLWAVAALHGGQMVISAFNQQWPVALMMLGFTMADIGILWAVR